MKKLLFYFLVLINCTACAQHKNAMTYIDLDAISRQFDAKNPNKMYQYTVWEVDTISKQLVWFEEKNTIKEILKNPNPKNQLRILPIDRIYKNELNVENVPHIVEADGSQEFHYGMIIGLKLLDIKIQIIEKNSFVPIYYFHKTETAFNTIKLMIKNPDITKIAKKWVNKYDTPKLEKGIQYENTNNRADIVRDFGRHLNFDIDGTFTDVYNAFCGNDSNIHKYNGKWKLVNKTNIEIYDLIEEYNKAHYFGTIDDLDMIVHPTGKFKIKYLDDTIMNLEIIKNYEERATYKIKS